MNPTPTPAVGELVDQMVDQVVRGVPVAVFDMIMANWLGWLAVLAMFGVMFGFGLVNRRLARDERARRRRRR